MALRDYFLLFWAPAIASALLLALLWAGTNSRDGCFGFSLAGFYWHSRRNIWRRQQLAYGLSASRCKLLWRSSCS